MIDKAAINNNHNRKFKLFNGNLFPEKLFGQSDADIEWSENKELSSQLFVHTTSYEIFKQPSNLFLFGRRGTGKTALIKMLDYEIKNGLESKYTYSKILNQEDTFYKLTIELRSTAGENSRNELTHILRSKMRWMIHINAMIAVVEKNKKDAEYNKYLRLVNSYLKEHKFLTGEGRHVAISPLTKAVEVFSDNFEKTNYDKAKTGIALVRAIRELYSTSYDEAFNALVSYLNEEGENCVVLIDSQELYDFDDEISEAAISGLMDAVLQVYNESSHYKVLAKVAFPSEIYPHIKPANQGKTLDKGHFIFWRNKDLLMFVAKRFCQLLWKDNSSKSRSCKDVENGNYHAFLAELLPKTTSSFGSDIEFDTLPYIISHTQKKPREIILLFNLILTLAKQNNIPFDNLTSDCIREGTNARLEDLSAGVLDMYRNIYPRADEIVHKTLFESKNILTYGEFQSQLKEANSLLASADMDRGKAERLFLETGIIGIIQERITDGKLIVEAMYEYQIKGVLTLQSRHMLAIHPMYYQALNINVDNRYFVYPKPSDEEQEEALLTRKSLPDVTS